MTLNPSEMMGTACSTTERRPSRVRRFLRAALLLALVLETLLLGGAGLYYALLVCDLPPVEGVSARLSAPSSFIYDRQGRVIHEVIHPEAGKNVPLSLEDIPLHLRQAVIATEDATFYRNPGFSPRGILRSLWLNLRAGRVVAGGSTITQQVVRSLLLSPEERYETSLRRKIREATLAYRLTRRYSKDEILALYLNQTYFGNFAFGVEAAARAYFGVPAAELDLAQAALLAGLIQSPAAYNPLEHPDAAMERQRVVLRLMVQQGYLTEEEAEQAAREPLYFSSSPFPYLLEAPHFSAYVAGILERELGTDRLRQGGLRVYTTLDLDFQRIALEVTRRRLEELNRPDEQGVRRRVDNAAVVILDPNTGDILAMVGSPDYTNARISGAMNAALALRQPGSALKPFTYATAFQSGLYTPATMILDIPTTFLTAEGKVYAPQNYDLRFHGPVSARTALASSLNLPAVRVLSDIGVQPVIDLCARLGITSLQSAERYGLTLTLGGGEVSLLELTRAYAGLAAGGRRVEIRAIARVEDAEGNILRQWQAGPSSQVITPQTAFLITDILADAQARRLGFGASPWLRLDRPAAVKTGTTTDWRDNWTIGYTPDYVTGVWVGNADNAPMYGVSGVSGAGPIWHDIMLRIHQGRPRRGFARPDGLVQVEVCAVSGLLPNPDCPHRRLEWFIEGTQPTETCPLHQRFHIDRRTGQLADASTPAEEVVERVYLVLPAEAQAWARQEQLPQPPTSHPPSYAISRAAGPSPIWLASPAAGDVYRLNPALPRQTQRLEVLAEVQPGLRLTPVELYVDDVLLARLESPPYAARWELEAGRHRFRARGRTEAGEWLESPTVEIVVKE
ncbi:MAG: penicillin-binding protein 1C [Anaerolineae bacterium]|nr:penicillin-binding protein 1C [Anaerolineae bacterium]